MQTEAALERLTNDVGIFEFHKQQKPPAYPQKLIKVIFAHRIGTVGGGVFFFSLGHIDGWNGARSSWPAPEGADFPAIDSTNANKFIREYIGRESLSQIFKLVRQRILSLAVDHYKDWLFCFFTHCDVRSQIALHRIQLTLHDGQLPLENESSNQSHYDKSQSKFISWIEVIEPSERSPIFADSSNKLQDDDNSTKDSKNSKPVEVPYLVTYDGQIIAKKNIERGAVLVFCIAGAIWYCSYYASSRSR